MELNYETFDLAEAIAGRTYPEDTFPVYFDAAGAYRFMKMNRELDRIRADDPAFEAKERELVELGRQLKSQRYSVTVRGTPPYVRDNIHESIRVANPALRPGEKFVGTVYRDFMVKMWAAQIVKFENPEGKIVAPLTEEGARTLWDNSPDYTRAQIINAIETLAEGEAAGFETILADPDFLSDASPEASADSTAPQSE